jgi:hypothetical protein
MGWWLAAIVAGALTTRMLVVVSPLVIMGNGAGCASRSMARKGNICPNSMKIERSR